MSNVDLKRDNLWKQFASGKSQDIRDSLIIEYVPLVKFVAGRLNIYFGSNIDFDDLVSYGVFGLIDAIDKFDLTKGVKFETYATLRIRGAIIDSIRQLDWVPRTLRQKSKEIEKAYNELEHKFGRSPSEIEVAQHLGINIKSYYKTINDLNISHLVSLDEFYEQGFSQDTDDLNIKSQENPSEDLEHNELKIILAESIDKLSEKEKKVITLYYFEELTLKEISAVMGVSESRVSQIHSKALAKLRGKFSKHKSILYEW